MTEQEINDIITGNWAPGQIATFEQAHEPAPHRADDNGFCACGGSYDPVHTDQFSHPEQGTTTQETYQCYKCKTWLFVQFDGQGVEYSRWYEVAKEAAKDE